jgi:integrase
MQLTVFKPSRRIKGKRVVSRYFVGRYSLTNGGKVIRVTLNTPDKAIARKRLSDIVLEKQREKEGLINSQAMRDAATFPISDHLKNYVADLKAQERDSRHIKDTSRRIERVIKAIGWKTLPEVNGAAFVEWRANLTVSAKTKKEYLVSLNAFFNWLIRQEKIGGNPFKMVSRVETRGKQVRQARAFTEKELTSLFAVSGPRTIVYQTLLYTGQRKAEVESLRWADLRINETSASALFRAATTKDKETRSIPLPPALAKELRKIQPADEKADKKVFFGIFPHYETFRADLKRAKISHRDSAGHVVHFHSFRKTHASFAARYGVAQKATQEVLGHSDANLTANIYTEMPSEAIRSELKKLPWITENGIETDPEKSAQICAQPLGLGGQILSDLGKLGETLFPPKYLNSPLKRRVSAALDIIRHELEMVDATGLEPVTPCV